LQVGTARTEGQDLLLDLVDVVDRHVDVELLSVPRVGPVGRLVVRGHLCGGAGTNSATDASNDSSTKPGAR
jgi:hypothetical protein